MNKSLLKDMLRSVNQRKKIFLSIMLMAFLGVGFYAGLNMTAPSMAQTQKAYYEETKMFDIQVFTTEEEGFLKEDIDKIKELDKYLLLEKDFAIDSEATINKQIKVLKILSLSEKINKVKLIKGSQKLSEGEVLIDFELAEKEKIKIGDKITIDNPLFKNASFLVKGLVRSPLYISSERGSSTIAAGRVDGFAYISPDELTMPLTTSLYIDIEEDEAVFAKSYKRQVKDFAKEVEKINENFIVQNRLDNSSASAFEDDIDRISNIATIFPGIFFLVAALISLTAMTRMIEEERTQIGTLKALGYGDFTILKKYTSLAAIACLTGSILGVIAGVALLPKLIYTMYNSVYNIEELVLSKNILYPILGMVLLTSLVVGATIYVCLKELVNRPAQLMRPKAPKVGKRVFLERFTSIWKRLSFTNKVTFRNTFRYKKRFFMTITGVAGCMSLIVAGFGLRSSVLSLLDRQYDQIFTHDLMFIDKEEISLEQIKDLEESFDISTYLSQTNSIELNTEDKNLEQVNLMISSPSLDKFVKLKRGRKKIKLKENEVAITDKAAELLSLKEGDKIKIKNANLEKEIKIDKIVENYLFHYIFMSEKKYESIFNKKAVKNTALVKFDKKINEEVLSRKILENPDIMYVSSISENRKYLDDIMQSLDYVALILITAAAVLAIAVLYTLSNVNISERIREIATIKVLGFNDKEVHKYITRENNLLIAIGIFLGLIVGHYANVIILKTAESDMMRLSPNIPWYYYLLSVLITLLFSFIISIANYFALKKVDMIESLKSVE